MQLAQPWFEDADENNDISAGGNWTLLVEAGKLGAFAGIWVVPFCKDKHYYYFKKWANNPYYNKRK